MLTVRSQLDYTQVRRLQCISPDSSITSDGNSSFSSMKFIDLMPRDKQRAGSILKTTQQLACIKNDRANSLGKRNSQHVTFNKDTNFPVNQTVQNKPIQTVKQTQNTIKQFRNSQQVLTNIMNKQKKIKEVRIPSQGNLLIT